MKIENLHELKENELLFTDDPCRDRINTTIHLEDYDWMNYKIDTCFYTDDIGELSVRFEYIGGTESFMYIKQTLLDKKLNYEFKFSSKIFNTYLGLLLKRFKERLNTPNPFYGGDIILDLFNQVLKDGTVMEVGPIKDELSWD